MRSILRLFAFVTVALLLILSDIPHLPAARAHPQVGPLNLSGEINGAPYRISVPDNWNGTLLVFAHGYRDKADHPGEVDDRTVTAFWSDPVEEQMLQHGYAIAGSAYRDNGWAVDEGIEDTNRLVEHFRSVVGVPRRTLLTGFSMGSLVAFHNAEHYGGLYDGFMPSCA